MNELMVIKEQEVLGKQFRIYGTVENPLFLAKDVAEWIEYDKTQLNKMLKNVDEDEKVRNNVTTLGGIQNTWFLTEDGLYEILMQSRKPIAKQFKKEVKRILKQIRQTGGYIPIQQEDSEEEIMAKALLIAQKTIEKKNELIKNLQPKADWFDKFMNSDGLFTSTQIAKMINYPSAQKLNKELNELKIYYKKGKNWIPYANVDETWYKVLTCEFNGASSTQLKFTPIGVFEICKLLNIELKEDILG